MAIDPPLGDQAGGPEIAHPSQGVPRCVSEPVSALHRSMLVGPGCRDTPACDSVTTARARPSGAHRGEVTDSPVSTANGRRSDPPPEPKTNTSTQPSEALKYRSAA